MGDLDENEMKFPAPDETPLKKETCVIIPMIRKKSKKSTLEIKPLLETQDNENELTCPVWVIKPLSEISPTKQKETDLTCPVCNKVLRSRNNLKEHIRIKHDGESKRESLLIKSLSETNPSQDDQEDEIDLTCPTCDQVLTSKHFLEEHIRTRHKGEPKSEIVEDENDLTCPACDKVFKSRNNVKEHIRVQHNGEVKKIMKVMWECKICGESFIKNLKRYNHLKSVHDATKNKKWKCMECLEDSFQRKLQLLEHLQTVHNVKYECSICNIVFHNHYTVCRHYEKKHPEIEKPWFCKICKKSFLGLISFRNHISVVHKGNKPHLCPSCGRGFPKVSMLNTHIKVIHEKIRLDCPKCDKKFKYKRTLRDHVAYVHEGKEFNCTLCAEKLTSKGGLRTHIARKHEDKYQYKDRPKQIISCPQCNETFKSKYSRVKHIETVHEGKIYSYQCITCQKTFQSENKMRLHIQYDHEGKKLDQCPHCDKKFKGEKSLKNHIDIVHDKITSCICTHCGKQFLSPSGLDRHIKIVHLKERQPCHLCDKVYSHKAKLQLHIRRDHLKIQPRFTCPHGCKKTFSDLKKHIQDVHEKRNFGKYVCKYCNKILAGQGNLNKHVATVHEGARPFGYDVCGRDFTTKQHRDIHLKKTHEGMAMKKEII